MRYTRDTRDAISINQSREPKETPEERERLREPSTGRSRYFEAISRKGTRNSLRVVSTAVGTRACTKLARLRANIRLIYTFTSGEAVDTVCHKTIVCVCVCVCEGVFDPVITIS